MDWNEIDCRKTISSILKTPKKKKESKKQTKTETAQNKIELGVIKAENVILRHSITTLGKTVLKQVEELTQLKEEMTRLSENLSKKISANVEACEKRIVNFYSDQDKICLDRAKSVSNIFQKKLDKISTKADTAEKWAKASSINPSTTTDSSVSFKIQNMQLQIEKLEHEMATMGDHLNDLISSNSSGKTADFAIHTNKRYKGTTAQKETKSHGTNAIMFCDSNKRHLNAQQLWRGIEILPCGDLLDLHSKIHVNKDLISSADMIVVNVGVNDTDKKSGHDVFENLENITSEIEGLALKH